MLDNINVISICNLIKSMYKVVFPVKMTFSNVETNNDN